MVKRKSLIIHFKDGEFLGKLNKDEISVTYISKNMKYAVIYIDEKNTKKVLEQLKKIPDILIIYDSVYGVDNYQL